MSVHYKADKNHPDYEEYETKLDILFKQNAKEREGLWNEKEYDKKLDVIHRKLMKEWRELCDEYKQIFTIPYIPEDEGETNSESIALQKYP